jgi:hypothetical protein
MKKLIYSVMILLVSLWYISGFCFAQEPEQWWNVEDAADATQDIWKRNLDQNPVNILDHIKEKANEHPSDRVQNTKLDRVQSKRCKDISPDHRFTITYTLCNIKENIKSYLQYIIYIWLTAATIILIRNGFQLVTAEDKWKQIWVFKKNIMYIVIWVVLLVAFYYILDIFVSLVNLVAE